MCVCIAKRDYKGKFGYTTLCSKMITYGEDKNLKQEHTTSNVANKHQTISKSKEGLLHLRDLVIAYSY